MNTSMYVHTNRFADAGHQTSVPCAICIYIYIYVYVFMFTNILMRTYMCIRIDARRRTSAPCASYIYTHIYICVFVYTYMNIYMYIHTDEYVYKYIHISPPRPAQYTSKQTSKETYRLQKRPIKVPSKSKETQGHETKYPQHPKKHQKRPIDIKRDQKETQTDL